MSHKVVCPVCEDRHLIEASAREATLTLDGIDVDVTIVERICERTGEVFHHTWDHDFRAEARDKMNAKLGNRAGTRVPGMRIKSKGAPGSAEVPAPRIPR